MSKSTQQLFAAVFFTLLAALNLAISSAFSKEALVYASHPMVVFFRFLIALIIFLPFILMDKKITFKTDRPVVHALRIICGFLVTVSMIYAFEHIPIANALVLNITYPLFVPLILFVLYRRTLSKFLWLGIIMGFIGVAFVLKPSPSALLNMHSLAALASGFLAAIVIICTRSLAATESAKKIIFFFFTGATFLSFIMVLFHWQTPQRAAWVYLVGIGITATIYQQSLAYALKLAQTSVVSPLMYISVLFGALLDRMFWHQGYNYITLLGFILIILGGSITVTYKGKQLAEREALR